MPPDEVEAISLKMMRVMSPRPARALIQPSRVLPTALL
jgi:hypothetical protein